MVLKIGVCIHAWGVGVRWLYVVPSPRHLHVQCNIDLTGSVMRLEEHPYKSTISEVLNTPHPTCVTRDVVHIKVTTFYFMFM